MVACASGATLGLRRAGWVISESNSAVVFFHEFFGATRIGSIYGLGSVRTLELSTFVQLLGADERNAFKLADR